MLTTMATKVDARPNKNPLRGIVDITDLTTTIKTPTIIITPKIRKRKISEVDQDNDEE